MSADLSYNAPALESFEPPPPQGEAPTLTLQLAMATARSSLQPMAGTLSTDLTFTVLPEAEHAAVLPADATPLTITFE